MMVRFYIYFGLLLSSLIALIIYESGGKNGEFANELLGFITISLPASIGALVSFVSEHRKSILLAIRCLLFKRKEMVYVSLSYLFQIKLRGQNQYLMIRGKKIKNQYQPIGGVYKKFASLDSLWRKWGAQETKNDPENSDDLRFEVQRRFIPEIRKWFYLRKNREIDVWREFCEEMLLTDILSKNTFKHIKPEFLFSKEEALIFRKGRDIKQFLIYDIFTINLSPDQEKELVELYNSAPLTEQYAFVDQKALDKELFIYKEEEFQLGYHARYLIPQSC